MITKCVLCGIYSAVNEQEEYLYCSACETKHKYQDKKGIIHDCKIAQIDEQNTDTRLVWTKCGKDVPANKSFISNEKVTCLFCI